MKALLLGDHLRSEMTSSSEKRDKMAAAAAMEGKRRRRLGICHHSSVLLPAPLRLLQDLAKPVVAPSLTSLQRRNAFRKNSAPAKNPNAIEIGDSVGPLSADNDAAHDTITRPYSSPSQSCTANTNATDAPRLLADRSASCWHYDDDDELPRSLMAFSGGGLSVISSPTNVVLYVADRRRVPSVDWNVVTAAVKSIAATTATTTASAKTPATIRRRLTYPVIPRGVRQRRDPRRRLKRRWSSTTAAPSWTQPNSAVK